MYMRKFNIISHQENTNLNHQGSTSHSLEWQQTHTLILPNTGDDVEINTHCQREYKDSLEPKWKFLMILSIYLLYYKEITFLFQE